MSATQLERPGRSEGAGRGDRAGRLGWVLFGTAIVGGSLFFLLTMETGVQGDARLANQRPGPAPYAFSSTTSGVGSSILSGAQTLVVLAVIVWLSVRRQRLHRLGVIGLGSLCTGVLDPLANWATFASLNPSLPHFPTDWPWVRLAPLAEPTLSLVGGYTGYYLITGSLIHWLAARISSRPGLVFVLGYVISFPLNAVLQWQWVHSGVLVYTQFAGPILDLGRVQLPLLVLFYDPFVYATVAVLLLRDAERRSRVLTRLAGPRPGRQVTAAALILTAAVLVPIGAFSAVRAAGLADHVAYDTWPFPTAKVYDPYGDVERAGRAGPFHR